MCNHFPFQPTRLQLMHQRDRNARAGTPDGMAQRDRTASRIHPRRVQPQLLDERQRGDRERLINHKKNIDFMELLKILYMFKKHK